MGLNKKINKNNKNSSKLQEKMIPEPNLEKFVFIKVLKEIDDF